MNDIERIYERYAKDVYRFALYLCASPSLADDITSETFVRVYTSRDPIQTTTVKAYLFTIARNLYMDERRRAARGSLDVSPGGVNRDGVNRTHGIAGLMVVIHASSRSVWTSPCQFSKIATSPGPRVSLWWPKVTLMTLSGATIAQIPPCSWRLAARTNRCVQRPRRVMTLKSTSGACSISARVSTSPANETGGAALFIRRGGSWSIQRMMLPLRMARERSTPGNIENGPED